MTYHSLLAFTALSLAVAQPAAAEPFLPTFSASNFSGNTRPTHSYFPVVTNEVRTYQGSAGESFIFTGMGAGPTILGVKTYTVRDDAFDGELLIEQTFDYYAQDKDGNVWYMGEDVTNYHYDKNGNLTGKDSASAWRAGVNGALPGYIMPKSLEIGFNYYQEHAPNDNALDQGTTMAILPSKTVAAGTFSNVLQVLETSEIDKSARGFKYYAPGRGLIAEEEGLKPNNRNPTQTFELTDVGSASSTSRPAFEFRRPPGE
jgi:hypothetical protein